MTARVMALMVENNMEAHALILVRWGHIEEE
jgi:hypothetical protein